MQVLNGGDYKSTVYLEQKEKEIATLDRQEEKRLKRLHRELEWVRLAPRARQAKSKARIEAFEKALEVNPHSASAHFELAVLYDQQKNDYAAALYHYEKARRLRPNAYDIAKDRLYTDAANSPRRRSTWESTRPA